MRWAAGCGHPALRKRNKMCRARATARVAPTGAWQEVRRVLRMSLLRRTKFPRRLTADAPNFDRGHWLRPTVVPADSRPLSWPPIGALPRNRLAYSAAGSASAISPLHPPPAALGSLPTGAERPRNDKLFTRGAAQNRAGTQCGQQSKTVRVIIKIARTVNQPDHQMVFSK